MDIKCADDNAPKWLLVMRAINGTDEFSGDADNPKILGMARYVGHKFPEQKSYWDQYQHDSTAWCGLTEAFCMAVCGYSGPWGPTDTDKPMWAQAWSTWEPWGTRLSRPVLGCIVVMTREGGGHVTTFEYEENGLYYCRGGNQSDSVNLSGYSPDNIIGLLWPRAAGDPPDVDDIPVEDRPMLERGDNGPDVFDLQDMLNKQNRAGIDVDGDFGPATEEAVTNYQQSRGLEVDGICGQETWNALYDKKPPYVPKPPPGAMPTQWVMAICDIAQHSAIANYNWNERGQAPPGYIKGVAVAFGEVYRQWKAGYGPAVDMAKKNSGDEDKDVLAWYGPEYAARGMDNSHDGADTLRHFWALILGLGMMESSGEYCCGRDQSVPPGYYGPESTTTEAGAWQTSYDAHSCSSYFDQVFDDFKAEKLAGYQEVFKEGVTCSSENWKCYGSGDGYEFQELSKSSPAMAAEACAITLRHLRKHYGPIGRKEAELRPEANTLLHSVQSYIDEMEVSV